MSARPPELRILVCGTTERGDDGAAMAAIARVLPDLPDAIRSRVEVRRCPQLDVTDLLDIGPDESCIVVDTVVGVEPGRVVVLGLDDLARRPAGVAPRSSHALSVDDALLIVEAVRGTLPAGMFVGIGGKWFGYGERFSRAVKAGLPAFGEAIRRTIEAALPVAREL
jgi:hydrogenase maturation protease